MALVRYLARERSGHRWANRLRRPGRDGPGRRRAARVPRPAGGGGVPEPRRGAGPVDARRRPGGRSLLRPCKPARRRSASAGRRDAAPGPVDRCRERLSALSASAQRWDAAAGRDCNRARGQTRPADPRRTHHRPGCHRRGSDPRAVGQPASRAGRHGVVDKPQPGGRHRSVRSRRRFVRRAAGGAGPGGGSLRRAGAPVHARPAREPAPARVRQERRAVATDRRSAALRRRAIAGLHVRSALHLRTFGVHRLRTGALPGDRDADEPLLFLGGRPCR